MTDECITEQAREFLDRNRIPALEVGDRPDPNGAIYAALNGIRLVIEAESKGKNLSDVKLFEMIAAAWAEEWRNEIYADRGEQQKTDAVVSQLISEAKAELSFNPVAAERYPAWIEAIRLLAAAQETVHDIYSHK